MFPDGLANSSGQVGRNYMRHTTGSVYAVFDKPVKMWRGTTMAGIVQDEAQARPEPRLRRRLRAGDAGARPAVHGGLPRPGRLGPRVHLRARRLPEHGRHVDRRRGHAAGDEPRHAEPRGHGRLRPAGRRTCISTTTRTTSPCATTPTAAARRSTRRSAPPAPSRPRPIRRRTTSAPTACRENPRDGVVNKWGQTHDIPNLFISDGSQFTTGAAENPTLTIVALAHPPGRPHRRGDERGQPLGARAPTANAATRGMLAKRAGRSMLSVQR